MKKLLVLVLLGVLAFVGLGVANLLIGPPAGTTLTRNAAQDPEFLEVALVMERACLNCHSNETKMPFYAAIPGAGHLVRHDIAQGRAYLDITADMNGGGGAPVSEVALAKTEWTVAQGTMPPLQYVALHWDAMLSARQKTLLADWIRRVRVARYAYDGLDPALAGAVVRPLRASIPTDPAKVALGERLYNDKRLSGDDTVSCATCHDLAKGGVDRLKFSKGVRDQIGPINAPTVYNAGLQFAQFWDGRAATLEDQADGPPNNPLEMDSNWPQILGKLSADAAFLADFTAAYPEGLSKQTVTHAIAEFERTLMTPNAPFDRFLQGQADALDDDQKAGWAHFGRRGCTMCHVGELLGGRSFERVGRDADYFGDRGTPVTDADKGRFNVTKNEADLYRQKVPTLRNVAQTAPYLHDGTAQDLVAAVDVMAKYELGVTLEPGESAQIARFLESLTGEYKGKAVQ